MGTEAYAPDTVNLPPGQLPGHPLGKTITEVVDIELNLGHLSTRRGCTQGRKENEARVAVVQRALEGGVAREW